MKKTAALLSVLVAVCVSPFAAACAPAAQEKVEEKYDMTAPAVFSADSERTAVNPLIYGQFIEHIETCIYDGIWSELVLDRKFYYEVGRSGLSPWKFSGDVTSDAVNTLSGGHSAVLSSGAAIYQEKLSFMPKLYDGYFWCDTDGGCKVKITISGGKNSVSTVVDVPANGGFTKYEFGLESKFRTLAQGRYTLEVISGRGAFDSLSLMPADNYKGMRKDTLDKLKELNSPMYRWPGGNFLSGYDWEDGIGDRDKRPSRRNLHYMGLESSFESEEAQIASDMVSLNRLGFYGGIEPNDYGLDEFMAMCEYVSAEPMMMVNTGLGTVAQAAAQVEYCNGAANTEYGALRAKNGHKEPYKISYWGVGNEMFGDWQLGHTSAFEYTIRHNLFTAAMRAKDSSIKIIASGNNASSWSDSMFAGCVGNFDYIAEHMYGKRDETDIFKHLKNIKDGIEYRIANHRALIAKYPRSANVKMAFTEYAYDFAECSSRLKDGMGIAELLNSVISNADVFEACCYSSTVNATQGCVTTEPFGAVMQGAGYVLKLYRDHMQGYMLEVTTKFSAQTQLDMALTISADGKTLALAVVNPSEYAVRVHNALFNKAESITRHTLTGAYPDSYDTVARNELYVEHADNLSNAVAPAMSVNVFEIEL